MSETADTEPSFLATFARRWPPWAAGVVLAALISATYAPALGLDFIYDDEVLLLTAPTPTSSGDYVAIFTQRRWPTLPYYRPIAWLTLAGQQQLHGLAPAAFHAINVALMIAAGLLGLALLRLPAFGLSPGAAFAGAALFAVHPLASSVVYPIAGRETLLAAVFGLATLLAFLRGRRIVALGCFAVALFAKEHAVALIPVLIWSDVLGIADEPPGRDAGRWIERHAFFAGLLLAYVLARAAILPPGGPSLALLSEPVGPLLSTAYALQTTFAPFRGLVYEPPAEVWFSLTRLAVGLLAVALAGLGVARAWPASRPAFLFFGGFALLTLAPSANLVFQESPFAERYVWLSTLGTIAIVLVALPGLGAGRWLAPAGVLSVAACAAISFGRAPAWADNEAFLTRWLETNPASIQAAVVLAEHYETEGDPQRAIEELRRALARSPDSALAHAALGEKLLAQRRPKAAVEHFRRATELDGGNAQYPNLLGVALLRLGERNAAAQAHRRALAIDPAFAHAHNNLGAVLVKQGEPAEARRHFERAVELLPSYAAARLNLASVLVQLGEPDAAAKAYRSALARQPRLTSALLGLSETLATTEDPEVRDADEALRLAQRAVAGMRHPNARALAAVAAAHAAGGDLEAAALWQARAVRAVPEARREVLTEKLESYLRASGASPASDRSPPQAEAPGSAPVPR